MPHGMFALLDMAIVGVPVIVISVWTARPHSPISIVCANTRR